MKQYQKELEDNFILTEDEEQLPPVEEDFPQKKPGLSFMARKRRHLLILLGGRAPKNP